VIVDLAEQGHDVNLSTQVLIIGAGIAGLLLACKLRDRGVHVIVLESGGREQKEETHPLNQVVLVAGQYRGALHGRFRCLGGTSTRWGGALIPFLPEDLAPRPYLKIPAWPVRIESLQPYLAELEELFEVTPGSYEEDCVNQIRATGYVPTGDDDFRVRFAKWPKFKHRNLATLFKNRIERDLGLAICINATATDFELDDQSRVRLVTARHQSGKVVKAVASHVVLCAGAIECTRLLLLLDWQHRGEVFKKCRALGNFFYDHISAPMATIRGKQIYRLNRMAGLRFTGNTMRSLRFELSPTAQAEDGVPSAFGHISFQPEEPTGFDVLRDFMRSLQREGRINPGLGLRLAGNIPYLAKAGLWRCVHKQLYWPEQAKYQLHVAAEQRPHCYNCIRLASDVDRFGLPLAAIDWRIERRDCTVFSAFIRRFHRFWTRHNLSELGELQWLIESDKVSVDDLSKGSDIFHPGGSTRMGADPFSAVVDENLRTFSISNLWVSSTSVFPSGASANPTLMLMLFTARLANHLAMRLAGG
jgi:choline dehydrogenase-like flavoprotein